MRKYFLVSFLSTNYSALRRHWDKYSVLKNEGKRGSDRSFKGKLGGKVTLLDWTAKKFIWEIDLDSPSGMVLEDNKIFVNSINLGKIMIVDFLNGSIIGDINNSQFNKPHSLIRTKRGFLVTSTGLDLILEIDSKGKTLFKYSLIEHGYNKDQFGNVRIINKGINHQRIVYPSLNQTTHVNFARYTDNKEQEILAVLFHQGELAKINKKTGKLSVVFQGLNHPHSLNDFSRDRYLLCDTDNNKIIVLNKNSFKKTLEFKDVYSWVQDAVCIDNFVYIADADNHRIVSMTKDNNNKDIFTFSSEYRIFQILPITL